MLNERFYKNAAIAVLSAVAAIIVLTFRHYGITWDEELQSRYGQAVVDYYFSGLRDNHYAEIFNLYLYGGMFDGLASLVDRYIPYFIYDTRHFLNACFGWLGLWGTWRLARLNGGPRVALLALVFLVLTPVYYGHMFNNPKDIPFAAGLIWSLYFMSRIMADTQRVRWGHLIKLSVILGLTLGVRVGGVMVLAFWCVPLGLPVLYSLTQKRNVETCREVLVQSAHLALRIVLPVTLMAYAVMLVCWPWAQQAPIANPWRALSEFSNFPQDVEVLLDGTTYRSTELPWNYVPLYFGIQLPELILFLVGAGLLFMPLIWSRCTPPQRKSLVLIMLTAFFPPVFAVIHHSALYDAVRHFLFVVPLLCVFAAVAADNLVAWSRDQFIQNWSQRLVGSGCLSVLVLFMMTQLWIMVRLHPYEYIYVNRFAGGVAGAYGKYESDYWGMSFKEVAERLQKFVAAEGGVPKGKIYKVAICGPWSSAMIYMPPDYEPVIANAPAEFFISTTRWECQNMRPGKEIFRVKRLGAPLAVVKDLREGYEYYEGNKNLWPK